MQLPNGSTLSIASTFGTSKTLSAITNATEAVGTLEASHDIVVNDLFVVTSGWEGLNNRVVRAKTVATNDVTFEGINTSNTTTYPAGSGIGSVREITAWTEILDVLGFETSGGEAQFYQYQTLKSRRQKQIPTITAAMSVALTVADARTAAWYAVALAAAQAGSLVPMRLSLPNGDVIYYNGYWSMVESPRVTVNEAVTLALTMSLDADVTRY